MDKIDELINDFQRKAIYNATFDPDDGNYKSLQNARSALRGEYDRLQQENAALISERDTQRELIGRPAEAIYGEYHDMRLEAETSRNGWIGAEMRLDTALKEQRKSCQWRYDDLFIKDHWSTSCGQEMIFPNGKPTENDMRYCCYCGKLLVEYIPEDA